MRRIILTLLSLALTCTILSGQVKRDPRAVGLAGSYGSVADGIFAVGYNPALLAFQQDKPFMLQLVGLDFGLVSNYISLSNLNEISGDTLTQTVKDQILNDLERSGGLNLYTDMHLPIPALNYASGNMALTSNMVILADATLPTGVMSLLLNGNPVGQDIDMTLGMDILGVNEFGFSFAIPNDDFAWGMTIKYLQGLFYFGIDPDSSYANLVTEPSSMYGTGVYYMRQGIGGSGLGLDLGFTTREMEGWRIGVSLINAVGKINWNQSGMIKNLLAGSDNIYGNKDDLFHFTWGGEILNDSMAVKYIYTIDSLNATTMSNDSIFYSNPTKDQIIYDLDDKGNLKKFSTRYPAQFRVSVSKRYPDVLLVSDLVAGFEDRFFSRDSWKWSIGAELVRNPTVPIRLGYSWGGADFKEMGMGFGIHKGPMIFDFGLAFRNGLWVHTMKGLNISLGLTITSFKSRKEDTPEPEG